MNLGDLAQQLEDMNRRAEAPLAAPRFSHLTYVVLQLRRGDHEAARAAYLWDRDKLELRGQDILQAFDSYFDVEGSESVVS